MAKAIAVVGASADRGKFGNKAVRAYLKQGWKVFPVNPKEKSIETLPCFPSLEDIPEKIDAVSVYVPPAVGVTLLEGIRRKNPGVVYFNPGAESEEIRKKAGELGINAVFACSIRAIGEDPDDY